MQIAVCSGRLPRTATLSATALTAALPRGHAQLPTPASQSLWQLPSQRPSGTEAALRPPGAARRLPPGAPNSPSQSQLAFLLRAQPGHCQAPPPPGVQPHPSPASAPLLPSRPKSTRPAPGKVEEDWTRREGGGGGYPGRRRPSAPLRALPERGLSSASTSLRLRAAHPQSPCARVPGPPALSWGTARPARAPTHSNARTHFPVLTGA